MKSHHTFLVLCYDFSLPSYAEIYEKWRKADFLTHCLVSSSFTRIKVILMSVDKRKDNFFSQPVTTTVIMLSLS